MNSVHSVRLGVCVPNLAGDPNRDACGFEVGSRCLSPRTGLLLNAPQRPLKSPKGLAPVVVFLHSDIVYGAKV